MRELGDRVRTGRFRLMRPIRRIGARGVRDRLSASTWAIQLVGIVTMGIVLSVSGRPWILALCIPGAILSGREHQQAIRRRHFF